MTSHINEKSIRKSEQYNVIIKECTNCTKGNGSWGNCIKCSNNSEKAQKYQNMIENVKTRLSETKMIDNNDILTRTILIWILNDCPDKETLQKIMDGNKK